MVVLGIDAHKRSHTVVAVDDLGRKLGERAVGTTTADHLAVLTWAERFGAERTWAVEDCRHLSRRLERDLLGAGERIVRVPPKLMAHVRDSARSYGKSDPIDALAVARAALREPDLPTAHLDGAAREVRLLTGHRDDLVAERTRVINRLRWHLHELDPGWEPAARSLWRPKNLDAITERLTGFDGLVARLGRTQVQRCRELTAQIHEVERELEPLVTQLAPGLLALCGCAMLTAAKIIGETAGIERFHSRHAFARHKGQRRSRSGRATAIASGSLEPGTGSSTPQYTGSPSRRRTTTCQPESCSSAVVQPGTRRANPSASSSADCPTSFTAPCSPMSIVPTPERRSPLPLDIGASGRH